MIGTSDVVVWGILMVVVAVVVVSVEVVAWSKWGEHWPVDVLDVGSCCVV